jgi:transposase-like protein
MPTFPRNQLEFDALFSSEEACIDFFIETRWPDGIVCPECHCHRFWRYGTVLKCSNCRRNLRILSGTLLQDTHLPLMVWYRAMWFIVTQKYGANALGLQRLLDISYPTSWTLLHKLRRAMVRPGRERLSGTVEVDETYMIALQKPLVFKNYDFNSS